MVREKGRRYYEYDDDDVPAKKSSAGKKNHTLLYVLLGGGITLALLCCVIGAVVVAIVSLADDPAPARLPGTWKGRFVMAGQPMDTVYIFNPDGTMREISTDLQGRVITNADARWRFRRGEIHIQWNNGSFERAVANWTDDNTMNYRIVDHSDFIQIGMTTTFRRQ